MLDIDAHGSISRKSPEEPSVSIVHAPTWAYHLGGAANVASLLVNEADVVLFGAVARDWAGALLHRICTEQHIDSILSYNQSTTTCKLRAYDGPHYISRTDVEWVEPIKGLIPQSLEPTDVVVLSDYAKGVFSANTIGEVQDLITVVDAPVIVDCKPSNYLEAFRGATVITPNRHEIKAIAAKLGVGGRTLVEIAMEVLKHLNLQGVAVTMGSSGSLWVDKEGRFAQYPVGQCVENPQVVGAGDAFVASLAIALGQGVGLRDAVKVATRAAHSYVGQERGSL